MERTWARIDQGSALPGHVDDFERTVSPLRPDSSCRDKLTIDFSLRIQFGMTYHYVRARRATSSLKVVAAQQSMANLTRPATFK
jgi:hypothetical protein